MYIFKGLEPVLRSVVTDQKILKELLTNATVKRRNFANTLTCMVKMTRIIFHSNIEDKYRVYLALSALLENCMYDMEVNTPADSLTSTALTKDADGFLYILEDCYDHYLYTHAADEDKDTAFLKELWTQLRMVAVYTTQENLIIHRYKEIVDEFKEDIDLDMFLSLFYKRFLTYCKYSLNAKFVERFPINRELPRMVKLLEGYTKEHGVDGSIRKEISFDTTFESTLERSRSDYFHELGSCVLSDGTDPYKTIQVLFLFAQKQLALTEMNKYLGEDKANTTRDDDVNGLGTVLSAAVTAICMHIYNRASVLYGSMFHPAVYVH